MTTYNEFASWLFPGDTIVQRNPADTPDTIEPLLEEVASCTNIPLDWIERTAGLVVEGLAGLQCLWYLHGARGGITPPAIPKRAPVWYSEELENLRKAEELRLLEKMRQRFPLALLGLEINWSTGVVKEFSHTMKEWESLTEEEIEAEEDLGRFPPGKERTTKLGKWLKKRGASDELMHAFETREMPTWEWEISCHPYDILTMSHERPWTSCMRPGGEYQYGPLTDMAAGSALLFFYRPGATKPCGRRVLRPFVADLGGTPQMTILDGGRTYGCGPDALNAHGIEKLLTEAAGVDFPVVKDSLCAPGRLGRALSRYIYSDIDHQECSQGDGEYDAAYTILDSVDWPPINLDFTTMAAVAESFKGLAEVDLEDSEEEYDIQGLAYGAYEDISGDMELSALYDSLVEGTISAAVDGYLADVEGLSNIPEHLSDDIYEAAKDYLESYLIDRVNEGTTLAFAIPPGDHEAVRIAERDAPIELNPPEYTGGDVEQALELHEDDDGEVRTADGEEVAEILLVSDAFRHFMPNSLWDIAVATGELSEWFDWEFAIRQDI